MLFQHTWKYVLEGKKTQTRRLVQEGDAAESDDSGAYVIRVTRRGEHGPSKTVYEVGQSYAVQPGRGQKSVTRIRVTGLRRERLQDMSQADAQQEMPVASPLADVSDGQWALKSFQETWNTMYHQPGQRWQDNPEVWVIEFELPFKPKK